jgi:Tfp pilus assembly protein FimT
MIELVGVLAILTILLASIVGAYRGWGQAAAVDGAANMLAAGLSRARELAITRRDPSGIICGNTATPGHAARGFFVLVRIAVTNTVDPQVFEDLAPTNYLPGNIQFNFPDANNGQPVILFTMEGRAYAPADSPMDPDALRFELLSPRGEHPLSRYVTIDPLTGIARVMQKE